MKFTISLILLTFTLYSAFAWKGCKLNEFGQNICVDELALLRQTGNKNFQVVKVKDHKIDYTVIELNSKQFRVDVNQLIGNKSCANYYEICRARRTYIKSQCASALASKPVKVVETFENNLALVDMEDSGLRLFKVSCLSNL